MKRYDKYGFRIIEKDEMISKGKELLRLAAQAADVAAAQEAAGSKLDEAYYCGVMAACECFIRLMAENDGGKMDFSLQAVQDYIDIHTF